MEIRAQTIRGKSLLRRVRKYFTKFVLRLPPPHPHTHTEGSRPTCFRYASRQSSSLQYFLLSHFLIYFRPNYYWYHILKTSSDYTTSHIVRNFTPIQNNHSSTYVSVTKGKINNSGLNGSRYSSHCKFNVFIFSMNEILTTYSDWKYYFNL